MKNNKLLLVCLSLIMVLVLASCDFGHQCDFGEEWKFDAENHWHECECGSRTDEAAHEFGDWTVSDGKRVKSCACGYTVADPTYKPEEEMATGSKVTIGVGAVVGVGAIGVTAYVLAPKKKKKES